MKTGDIVINTEELYPFYWNYAGNPDIIIKPGSIGVIAHPKCSHGDVIIDFPIYTKDLKVKEGYDDRVIEEVWRVRLSKTEAKEVIRKSKTKPDFLKFHFFCGGLELDCELPFMFNRGNDNE